MLLNKSFWTIALGAYQKQYNLFVQILTRRLLKPVVKFGYSGDLTISLLWIEFQKWHFSLYLRITIWIYWLKKRRQDNFFFFWWNIHSTAQFLSAILDLSIVVISHTVQMRIWIWITHIVDCLKQRVQNPINRLKCHFLLDPQAMKAWNIFTICQWIYNERNTQHWIVQLLSIFIFFRTIWIWDLCPKTQCSENFVEQ